MVIRGRHGKITFAISRTIPKIVFAARGIPSAFIRVNVIETVIRALIETHVVEDEEFCLSPKHCLIPQSGGSQIHLSLAGDIARIAVITLASHGIDDVGDHAECWSLCKWVYHIG